ncbi:MULTISPECIES: phosphodiesterase [Larsenimonas]|uniref:Phosphodiesterase n=1 Tax=Larsenimonas suaedae TaxID=1851019 RepID=A0ABU1GZQ5_9GAMM|nr:MULTISPECIES: phosphodiesterase [Larsenimonas]MCM2972888.1 phosphodiesterase [Larsenimonas suaedae]MCM5704836.1 phosphodiesterase [Larsenimonas salina]MDR5896987.1 phosphodiesterase [Larsenimonas suaedae]
MRLLQLTDCHLSADPRALYRLGFATTQLERVIEEARAARPDVVLVTGDISNDDSPASYQQAVSLLSRFACPWFWLPGNHDNLQVMREARSLIEEVDLGPWRALLLDTHVSGEVAGELGEAQIDALERKLEADDRPTLIAMHHPPISVNSEWMDQIRLRDEAAFWHILSTNPQVRLVLAGHVHHAFHGSVQGIDVLTTPATSDQFLPGSDRFQLDGASRPGYRIVDIDGEEWTSWVERVSM